MTSSRPKGNATSCRDLVAQNCALYGRCLHLWRADRCDTNVCGNDRMHCTTQRAITPAASNVTHTYLYLQVSPHVNLKVYAMKSNVSFERKIYALFISSLTKLHIIFQRDSLCKWRSSSLELAIKSRELSTNKPSSQLIVCLTGDAAQFSTFSTVANQSNARRTSRSCRWKARLKNEVASITRNAVIITEINTASSGSVLRRGHSIAR